MADSDCWDWFEAQESLPPLEAETDVSMEEFYPPPRAEPVSGQWGFLPEFLIDGLSRGKTSGWDYHPRSDRHSNIKGLGLLVDLMRTSPRLAQSLEEGLLTFGINKPGLPNSKNLDLVIGSPRRWDRSKRPRSWRQMASRIGGDADIGPWGDLREGLVSEPILAVESKAIMTDHVGALPRLLSELETFARDWGRDSIVGAFFLVNISERFISPGKNGFSDFSAAVEYKVSRHPQGLADRIPSKLLKAKGFDAAGGIIVECPNDGSGWVLRDGSDYEDLVRGLTKELDARL